ncbi:MAG: glycosyltransferase N-terminal domain-containing protein [Myxococcota bacterium]|nr:glycosyltransferase N-terminal domain-containing protein [Myxococcota bacterium]
MRWLRLFLTYPLFLLAFPLLLVHPKLRAGQRQRFGFHPHIADRAHQDLRIWLHGASAGDVLAIQPTAAALRALHPHATLIATSVTNSGRAILDLHASLFDHVGFIPWDLPGSVSRTLDRLRPDAIVLEYAELWPELLLEAKRRNIKVVLQNGRFAGARLDRYRDMFKVTGNLLSFLDLLLMRDATEEQRALELGAAPNRVHVTGNTKLDHQTRQPDPAALKVMHEALGLDPDRPLLVAGSTHEGEEEALFGVFHELLETSPELKLIVAPRYIERAERLLQQAHRQQLTARLRTEPPSDTQVVILDTIGELATVYSCATLVFVGGSLVDRGGHNIIEPAQFGCPVLFGPHMGNVEDSVQLLLGRGGIQVSNAPQLAKVLGDLLNKPQERTELGILAQQQVEQARGAATRNAEFISEAIKRGQTQATT